MLIVAVAGAVFVDTKGAQRVLTYSIKWCIMVPDGMWNPVRRIPVVRERFITFLKCVQTDFVNCWFGSEGHCQNPKHWR